MGRGFTPIVCLKAYTEYVKPSEDTHSRGRRPPRKKRRSNGGAIKHEEIPETSSSVYDENGSAREIEYTDEGFNNVSSCPVENAIIACNRRGWDGIGADRSEEEMEDTHMKGTPFIDVEDAILITAIQQLKQGDEGKIKDFGACEDVLDYLGVDITGILPWRLDKTVEARLNILFRRRYVPWSL